MQTQTQTVSKHFGVAEVVRDYLLVCRVSKRAKTVERIDYCLRKLLDWCHARNLHTLQDLTRRELLLWSLNLQQQYPSKQTVWTFTSTVKAFLRWCEEEGLLSASPLKRGDFPAKPKPAPDPLTVYEVKQLLKAVDGKTWMHKRDTALILVLLHSGCRRGELVQMKVGDVERGFSLVTQKGGRQHAIHLSSDCVKAIQSYLHALRVQKSVQLAPEDTLWVGRDGEPMTGDAVRRLFERLSRRTGLHLYAHRMRATSATLRLALGASTETVRLALGHADTRSIQSYVRLAQHDASRLLEQTSPVNLLKERR